MMKKHFRAVPVGLVCAAVLLSLLPGTANLLIGLPKAAARESGVPGAQTSVGLYTIEAGTPQGLQELFAPGGGALPLVSAHRGGAGKGFPENCIATFEETLRHCWRLTRATRKTMFLS